VFALALRAAEFVLSVIRGHGVELLWLAALLLAAAWPLERKPDAKETFARFLDRKRGADEHPRTSSPRVTTLSTEVFPWNTPSQRDDRLDRRRLDV
jgi:hypothetical protein